MTDAKNVGNGFRPHPQTVAEKVVAVLRQPLFTFSFQIAAMGKSEPPVQEASQNEQKKAKEKSQNRMVLATPPAPDKPKVKQNPAAKGKSHAGLFTPLRNQEEFEKILFVLRACETHGHREFAKVLRVERVGNGSRLIATDGRRLHVAEIRSGIKPGDYKPLATKDEVRLGEPIRDTQFPDWERVVPDDAELKGCFHPVSFGRRDAKRMGDAFERLSGEKVNPKYLADLTKKPWMVYRRKEKGKALLLKEYGTKMKAYAVIMPLAS